MSYTSILFYVLVLVSVTLYYIVPKKRWIVLLLSSIIFYIYNCVKHRGIILFLVTVVIGYVFGRIIVNSKKQFIRVLLLIGGIAFTIIPLLLIRISDVVRLPFGVISVGISFYSLQQIAYLVDAYKKNELEKDFFKYLLFMSFFPQIIQGPIPRYKQLSETLFSDNRFNPDNIEVGFQRILCGFLLKYLIADKCSIVVNGIFDNYRLYTGFFYWIAAILYSIQLYSDFLACVYISRGVAKLFGINLINNFNQPYFATSIKDFWRRWHISLSTWLRDYIYIPLGGSKKGRLRKYGNLLITFLVSGYWHGGGIKYIVWGVIHAIYQTIGDATAGIRKHIAKMLGINVELLAFRFLKVVFTDLLVAIAWVIFRADSLSQSADMIYHMFSDFNPWVLFDDSLLEILEIKEWLVLSHFLMIMLALELCKKRINIGKIVRDQQVVSRYIIYIFIIVAIWIFGTYGFGFNPQDFIYGGF